MHLLPNLFVRVKYAQGVVKSARTYGCFASKSSELQAPMPFEKIPGPKQVPIFGSLWQYWPIVGRYNFDRIDVAYQDLYDRYGPIVRENFGSTRLVHLYNPDDFLTVYRSEGKYPRRISHRALAAYRNSKPDLYSCPGLFPSNGEQWLKFRRFFQVVLLSPKTINMLAGPVEDVADDLVRRIPHLLDEKNELSTQTALFTWAVETITAVTLDIRLGCLSDKFNAEAAKAVKAAQATHDSIHETEHRNLWQYIPTPSYMKLVKAQTYLESVVRKYMDQALKEMSDLKKEDIMLAQLWARGAKDKDVFTMVMDLIMAGIDTTAFTTTFTLYHLAKNPDVQERLFQELKQHCPTKSDRLNKVMDDLSYLKYVTKESFRINPVAVGAGRILDFDIVLCGYEIPAGTVLIMHHQVSSMFENEFRNPKKFIPERWIRHSPLKHEPGRLVSVPFGFGKRMCIGKRIAELEMFMGVAKIIRNFKISYHYQDIETRNRLVNVPDRPVKLHFEARNE